MTKALLKKQLLEIFAFLFTDAKTGKRRTGTNLLLFAALYVFVFGYLAVAVYYMAKTLALPMIAINHTWLYMALISLLALTAGIVGGVFSCYTTLYAAKDNDLLLSFPIPPIRILVAKLSGIYLNILFYLLLIIIPATAVLFIHAPLNPLAVIFSICLPFLLALLALVISALLGFGIALLAAKISRFLRPLTIALVIVCIGAYFYIYTQINDILNAILANATTVGEKVKSIFYPFYAYGTAATGDALSFLLFALLAILLFATILLLLSRTFLNFATTKRGEKAQKYKAVSVKAGSARRALLKKELRRFTGSTTYMLNTGLGILFMPAAGIALIFFKDKVTEMLSVLSLGDTGLLALFATAMLIFLASMNSMAAAAISLEGKNLWILRSFPLAPKDIFIAKLSLQLIFTLPVILIPITTVVIILDLGVVYSLLVILTTILFVFFNAVYCLTLNLKWPSFTWINEAVPLKQSAPATLSVFGGWALSVLLIGVYFIPLSFINGYVCLAFFAVLLLALTVWLGTWLFKKGTKLFETYN